MKSPKNRLRMLSSLTFPLIVRWPRILSMLTLKLFWQVSFTIWKNFSLEQQTDVSSERFLKHCMKSQEQAIRLLTSCVKLYRDCSIYTHIFYAVLGPVDRRPDQTEDKGFCNFETYPHGKKHLWQFQWHRNMVIGHTLKRVIITITTRVIIIIINNRNNRSNYTKTAS